MVGSYTWLLVFIVTWNFQPTNAQQCTGPSTINNEQGTYTLIGMYPAYISNKKTSGNGFMYMETVRYVLDKFNKNSTFKVGYRFYDTCGESNSHVSVEIGSDILLNSPSSFDKNSSHQCNCNDTGNLDYVIGVVGPASSTVSELTANILLPSGMPIISYSSTSVKLNDKELFPYFMRTIAADDYQSRVIFDLVNKFGWKYVSLVASDNVYGRSGTAELVDLFKANGICLAVHKFFAVPYNNDEIKQIAHELQNAEKAGVIIVWAVTSPSRILMNAARDVGLFNKTWIFTEGVGASNTFSYRDPRVVQGAFSIVPYSGNDEAFEKHFFNLRYPSDNSTYVGKTWLRSFLERYNIVDETIEARRAIFQTHKIGLARNSVEAYLTALKSYIKDHQNRYVGSFPKINRTLFFKEYLRKVKFHSLNGDLVEFNEFGTIKNQRYKILNIQYNNSQVTYALAGYWSHGYLTINESKLKWPNDKKTVAKCSEDCLPGHYPLHSNQICCWKCVPCQGNYHKPNIGQEICKLCPMNSIPNDNKTQCIAYVIRKTPYDQSVNIIIYALTVITSLCILFTIVVFVYFRNEKIIKASNFPLSITQLVAQLLVTLCSFLLTIEISLVTCAVYHYLTSFFTIMVLAVILIKTELLLRIFSKRRRLSQKEILTEMRRQVKILVFVLTTYIILHGLLWDLFPITVAEDLHRDIHTLVRTCDYTVQTMTSALCVFLLSMVCSVQVFRNRKLPSLYNEGKVIMYAAFVLDIGLIVILMVTLIVKKENRSIVVFYSVYASNTWIFVAIFSGKVYRLLAPCIKKARHPKQAISDSKTSFCIYDRSASVRTNMSSISSPRDNASPTSPVMEMKDGKLELRQV
ncbi:metabotropic glutamate receptor 4-like [Clytia hemisphaerica]|uniref:metabotropic glutamate receptor 4-like n=1 Tax=Clytia hemisphaerica TaxID=252671 RepID=UPI0034D7B7E7